MSTETTQHTPGPWRITHSVAGVGGGFNSHCEDVVGPDGKEICRFTSFATEYTRYATDELRENRAWMERASFSTGGAFPYSANARLIAAAPALLSELEAAMKDVDCYCQYGQGLCNAHAVIARARGT